MNKDMFYSYPKNLHIDMADEMDERSGKTLKGSDRTIENVKGMKLTRIHVRTKSAAEALKKEQGRYYTADMKKISFMEDDEYEAAAELLSGCIAELLPKPHGGCTGLVAGLGNRSMTPDALGPLTVEKLIVSRHLKGELPEADKLGNVCAVVPGVTGVTGIESADILRGICGVVEPDYIILVDALSSGDTKRIGSSVQLSDTGIEPGSGIGNKRFSITERTMGIPVISIGIPMVIYAGTLAGDMLKRTLGEKIDGESAERIAKKVFDDDGGLVVTPKDIDTIIKRSAELLAYSLNIALHTELSKKEILNYMM